MEGVTGAVAESGEEGQTPRGGLPDRQPSSFGRSIKGGRQAVSGELAAGRASYPMHNRRPPYFGIRRPSYLRESLVQSLGKIRPFYARERPSPPDGRPAAGGLVQARNAVDLETKRAPPC